jgi:hypothetical protein
MDTLFDRVHAWTHYGKPPVKLTPHWQRDWNANLFNCRMALRQAKRFVLDDAFVAQVVRKAASQPTKMINLCHLANLPFDRVWIEFSNNARVDAQFELGTSREGRKGKDCGTAAFLLERHKPDQPGTYLVSHAGDNGQEDFDSTPIGPAAYGIDVGGLAMVKTFGGMCAAEFYKNESYVTQHKVNGFGWGYFTPQSDGKLAFAVTEELERRGITTVEPRFFGPLIGTARDLDSDTKFDAALRYFNDDLIEGRGNLRFIVALLAMLDTCPIEYRHRAAKGYKRMRLRNVSYLDSHELTIHCGRRRIVNVVDESIKERLGGWHNARHSVRGFWRNAEYGVGLRGCLHEAVERDGNYALCGKCQRLLVWVDHHQRGDAALGYVSHDYRVAP